MYLNIFLYNNIVIYNNERTISGQEVRWESWKINNWIKSQLNIYRVSKILQPDWLEDINIQMWNALKKGKIKRSLFFGNYKGWGEERTQHSKYLLIKKFYLKNPLYVCYKGNFKSFGWKVLKIV